MTSVVQEFDACNVHFTWINAISKVGYLALSGEGNDLFVRMWTIAERVGQFLRTDERVKAEAIGYHFLDKRDAKPRLFVFPRFDGDYSNNNEVYNIAEAEEQKQTSSPEIIEPLVKSLEEYLNK